MHSLFKLTGSLRESNVFTPACMFTGVGGPHVTLSMMYWTSLYSPLVSPSTSDMGPSSSAPPDIRHGTHLALVAITGDLFKLFRLKTHLLPTCTNIWWLKHVPLASGWYASYWNAFLLGEQGVKDMIPLDPYENFFDLLFCGKSKNLPEWSRITFMMVHYW